MEFKKTEFNDEIKALHISTFGEDNAAFFDALKTKPYYNIFVATQNGVLVAYCIITLIAGEAEIINIATKPEFRGRGAGYGLLSFALKEIKADRVFLEVNINNMQAISLYKKCGFKQIAIRKNYYSSGDAIVMQL